MIRLTRFALAGATLGALLLAAGCERPPVETQQIGYRGLAMEQVTNPRLAAKLPALNQVPEPLPPAEAVEGPLAGAVYQNVKVLDDLSVTEFTRTMLAITQWVAPPDQSCAYCHGDNFADDTLYTKVVARRMLQMVRDVNTNWKSHVAGTGVTCFTCHRGKSVPANVWYEDPGPAHASFMVGNKAGQNAPAAAIGLTSLPGDPFSTLLRPSGDVKVISDTALPAGSSKNIKGTEGTYALMMHVSQALGVNCTFCHNSRSFAQWDASTPKRATAWYGIRMVRDVNAAYLEPLKPVFPAKRLGPHGDVAKVNCTTCHQGANKPLLGVSMLKDYPELAGRRAPPPAAAPAGDAAPVAAAEPAAAP